MAEHLFRRLREWREVVGHLRGVEGRDRTILRRSFYAAPLTTLRNLDGFEPPCLLDDLVAEVKGVGQFALRGKTDDVIHVLSSREPKIREAIESRLRAGDTFVDAGANIGFYSVLAAKRVGTKGRVCAIEMMPATNAALRRNLALNSANHASIVPKALSDRAGQFIRATVPAGKYGQASIVADGSQSRAESVDVETTTLAVVLRDLARVRVMKMDLEGAEFAALTGCGDALEKIDTIIYENNSNDPRIAALLEQAGFVVAHLANHDFIAERCPVA